MPLSIKGAVAAQRFVVTVEQQAERARVDRTFLQYKAEEQQICAEQAKALAKAEKKLSKRKGSSPSLGYGPTRS